MSDAPKKEEPKTGHIYDGIEELDYPPPFWFTTLFCITIVFGAGYYFYYGIGDGPTLTEEYAAEKAADEYATYERNQKNGGAKGPTEEELAMLLGKPEVVKAGADAYQLKCAACHGVAGGGGIGPNLTDRHWLHGGKLAQIAKTITEGVIEKGMPPWGASMKPQEIASVTVFIRSKAGTQPTGAKAPQGTLEE